MAKMETEDVVQDVVQNEKDVHFSYCEVFMCQVFPDTRKTHDMYERKEVIIYRMSEVWIFFYVWIFHSNSSETFKKFGKKKF